MAGVRMEEAVKWDERTTTTVALVLMIAFMCAAVIFVVQQAEWTVAP